MANYSELFLNGLPAVTGGALVNALQAFSKGGELAQFTVLNFDQTTGYLILLLDQTAALANGAIVPVDQFFIAAATPTVPGVLGVSYAPFPLQFTKGLWIAGSTALTTSYTLTQAVNTKLAISAKGQTS